MSNLPGATGPPGEIVVVIDAYLWESPVGDTLFQNFSRAQHGLPQDEPEFSLANIPHRSFTSVMQQHRNIMVVTLNENAVEEKLEVKRDGWARGQLVTTIEARTPEKLIELIKTNLNPLRDLFHFTDRTRLATGFRNRVSIAESDEVAQKTHVRMSLQQGFDIVVEEQDFTWLKLDKQRSKGSEMHQISMGLLIYSVPYRSQSQFLQDSLEALRDSITRKFVPGPSDSSYMTISHRMGDPQLRQIEHNGSFAVELRGLWRVENDFMAGPFVSLAQVDEKRNRIVVVDGYVFAPQFDKRDYLREIEAMLYSLELE